MTEKPKICPFDKNCPYDPKDAKCDQNYEECAYYSWQIHKDTIPLPLICPLFGCGHKHKACFIEAEGDYRDCEWFSKWFWKPKAKK